MRRHPSPASRAHDVQHLVGVRDLSGEQISQLLDLAVKLREEVHKGGGRVDLLRGRTVALVFMEASTRTRFSFEMAATRLGATPLAFSAAASSTVKGETLADTTRLLQAIGADALVLRHPSPGACHLLARTLRIPVLNAGEGINEHPTQGLLDALTLRDHFGRLEGRTIAIVGDIRHSRVARSNCFALPKLGARVIVAGPGTLAPAFLSGLGVEVRHRIDDVLDEADAIMMLRIQKERLGPSMIPTDEEFARFWGLDEDRLARAKPGLVVMHPAPMNRGVEISSEVADGGASVIFRQMENGVAVRMACLLHLLGGGL